MPVEPNEYENHMPMSHHIPILVNEIVAALQPEAPGTARLIDGTVGGGGHSRALLEAGVDAVLACDRDASAIDAARQALAAFDARVSFFHVNYVEMRGAANGLGWRTVDAILLDLGLSSDQLDDPARGFSFRFEAPLDMRFDREAAGETADDLVNGLAADELAELFFRYGEERYSRRIAREIVRQRPIRSATMLADVVAGALPPQAKRRTRVHPATKVFQALRIAVNNELAAVERVIPIAIDLLRPGGRLAVITFHSLEDRLVKQAFKRHSTSVAAPPGMASIEEQRASVKLVNRKPISPGPGEVSANPRSRSAKLRVVERL